MLIAVLRRRHWRRPESQLVVMDAWLSTFSADAYRPMLRLGERDDARFLASQRGPDHARKYRRLQRELLRGYLHSLATDYDRIHSLATHGADGVQEKMEFIFSLWHVELRIAVDQITPCTVDTRPLLDNVEQVTARARDVARRRHEFRIS